MKECKNCRALEYTLIIGRGYIADRKIYNCALGNKIIIKDEKPYSECKDKTTRVKRGE